MKTFKLCMALLLILGAVSCDKYGSIRRVGDIPNGNFDPNSNAANLIAGALAVNSNGVAIVSSNETFTAQSLANQHLACGTSQKDTVNQQNAPGASTTYSYNSTYDYTLNCNSSNQPDNTATSSIYSGNYSNASMLSTNAGSSIFTTSGLAPTATTYVVNGEFKQSGSFQSKTATTNAGNHSIDIILTNLTFTKATRAIASGNATITVSQTQPGQTAVTYNGTLVFNGNNTATLTLNAVVYNINLITGVVTKV